jgi:hypothetical protein
MHNILLFGKNSGIDSLHVPTRDFKLITLSFLNCGFLGFPPQLAIT